MKSSSSVPFVVSYFDTFSEDRSRKKVQTALKALADLQEIACVCIDHIRLPDDILEANSRLGAYTSADLVWFHFSKRSLMPQKAFVKAIRALFADVQLGSPVWVHLLPARYKDLYQCPWND